MMPRGMLRAGALVALIGTAACHSYRPVELAGVRRGARLRVEVDQPVAVRLRDVTIEQARRVDAEAVGVENGNLVLSALWVERAGGLGTPGEGWTVSLPVGAVGSVREKRFSWWRSAVLVGAVVVGSAVGWSAFGVGGSGGPSTGDPGEQL